VRVGPRGGVGPACVAGVCGPRKTGAGRARRYGGVGGARSSPWTDLDNPSGGGGGGGGGVLVGGTLSEGRAGPPSSWSSPDGRGLHVSQRGGCVAVRGFRGWKGRGPSALDSTPPGAPRKYPDLGQRANDLSESQGDRIWSGAGCFPRGFPNPPTTCLNFSLSRDLSVWRIWGGHFSRWRSGCGGVY